MLGRGRHVRPLLGIVLGLALTGCGASSAQTTAAPPAAPQGAAQQAIVEVLTRYEKAYSARNASGLRSTLAPTVERAGEGADGCERATGEATVLVAYEAQWRAGAGRYEFVGLSPQAVKVTGQKASVKLSYRIAPASEGPIEFDLGASGKRWLITNITASCHAAPATHLNVSRWKALESRTDGSLIILLPGESRLHLAGEEGRLAFERHEEDALSEERCLELFSVDAPCFRQVGALLVTAASEGRVEASALAGKVPGPCAGALRNDEAMWELLELLARAFERGRDVSAGESWERDSVKAEHLLVERLPPGEAPTVELGDGLQACRPPGVSPLIGPSESPAG
jgi:hypothetical protein